MAPRSGKHGSDITRTNGWHARLHSTADAMEHSVDTSAPHQWRTKRHSTDEDAERASDTLSDNNANAPTVKCDGTAIG
ncbi:hypothetical protein MN210_18570 [Psychrobacter raelei]|uniref:Uncharacterized protein n=1 Tax=Psychrobacter raelei TaxID=2565531 RepID=A0AAU6PTH9_9GAMM